MMALAYYGHRSLLPIRPREDYASVGVPPEWEVPGEPTKDGVLIAAVARILRGALTVSRGAARKGSHAAVDQG